ncbi:tyrosine-type recombinase/integrase [Halobaculum gomorrense]
MLHGLRADELEHVCTDNLRELDSEDSAYKLRVRSGKTGWREVPVSTELVQRMKMLKNVRSAHADEELISVHKGSVQRWVRNIAQDLAETHNDDWQYLTAHDLRRTWATRTYYALDSHHAVDLIMRWGGWDSRDVFTQNYLGRESDEMAASMMQSLGMLG